MREDEEEKPKAVIVKPTGSDARGFEVMETKMETNGHINFWAAEETGVRACHFFDSHTANDSQEQSRAGS